MNRKYRRFVRDYVTFTIESKKFRVEDQLLREWLAGEGLASEADSHERPSIAFEDASSRAPRLHLHSKALAAADELDPMRWAFAAKSAELLATYAADQAVLGPLRNWDASFGVAFAGHGRVAFRYVVTTPDERVETTSEWHLKSGDNTSADKAARIHFAVAHLPDGPHVLIGYVGPHSEDGEHRADFGAGDVGTTDPAG